MQHYHHVVPVFSCKYVERLYVESIEPANAISSAVNNPILYVKLPLPFVVSFTVNLDNFPPLLSLGHINVGCLVVVNLLYAA